MHCVYAWGQMYGLDAFLNKTFEKLSFMSLIIVYIHVP